MLESNCYFLGEVGNSSNSVVFSVTLGTASIPGSPKALGGDPVGFNVALFVE